MPRSWALSMYVEIRMNPGVLSGLSTAFMTLLPGRYRSCIFHCLLQACLQRSDVVCVSIFVFFCSFRRPRPNFKLIDMRMWRQELRSPFLLLIPCVRSWMFETRKDLYIQISVLGRHSNTNLFSSEFTICSSSNTLPHTTTKFLHPSWCVALSRFHVSLIDFDFKCWHPLARITIRRSLFISWSVETSVWAMLVVYEKCKNTHTQQCSWSCLDPSTYHWYILFHFPRSPNQLYSQSHLLTPRS